MSIASEDKFLSQDEQDRNQFILQNGQTPEESTNVSLTPQGVGQAGPASGTTAGGSAPPPPSNRSGSYTSLSKYRDANLEKAKGIGDALGNVYQGYADSTQGGITQTADQFGNQLASNSFNQGGQILTADTLGDFQGQGADIVNDARYGVDYIPTADRGEEYVAPEYKGINQGQKDIFDTLSNVSFQGDTEFTGSQKSNIEGALDTTYDYGRALTSGDTRGEKLRSYFDPKLQAQGGYSQQGQNLDNYLLGTEGAQDELNESQQYVRDLGLDEYYEQQLDSAAVLGGDVKGLHDDLRTNVRDVRDTVGQDYSEAVEGRLTTLEDIYGGTGEARSYVKDLLQDYKDGVLELTELEQGILGLEEGDLLFHELTKSGILGTGQTFSRGGAVGDTEARKLAELNALGELYSGDTYSTDIAGNKDAGSFTGQETDKTVLTKRRDEVKQNVIEELKKEIDISGTGAHAGPTWTFLGIAKGATGPVDSTSQAKAKLNLANKLGVDLNNPVDVEAWEQALADFENFSSDDFEGKIGAGDGEEGDAISNVSVGGGNTISQKRAFGKSRGYHPEYTDITQDARQKTKQFIEDKGLKNYVKTIDGRDDPEYAKLVDYLTDKEAALKEIE